MAILMQLALDMGTPLVELNKRMPSREFTLWAALHQMQPRGVERDNFHSAMIATVIANTHAPKGKTFHIHDFMHEDQETKQQREFNGFVSRMRAVSIEG